MMIQRIVEEDRYCVYILVQIGTINATLEKVGYRLTERHMKLYIVHAKNAGKGQSPIHELLQVMKPFSK